MAETLLQLVVGAILSGLLLAIYSTLYELKGTVTAKLSQVEETLDDHEERIRAMEPSRAKRKEAPRAA